MRVTSIVAGLALVLAACGGEKAGNGAATTTDSAAMSNTAGTATATAGATHDVDMVMEGTQPKFVPASVTVKAGDVIRFHNKSGAPHNVNFWPDSIPSNAASAISITPNTSALDSEMIMEQDGVITVTLNNSAPAGTYKFYCMPHLAMGMKGQLTIQ
ncbi:MAG: cupredoxin domain-containing protein [Gemmatimonadales bacterium]|nr:cupredoxin domain-containing protein [Gemmatimonadales bacterium]